MSAELENITEVVGPDGQTYWPMSRILHLAGITRSTWTSYVTREQAPQPHYRVDTVRLWSADEIRTWLDSRTSRPATTGTTDV
ncbi:hypothetical protein [Corynebacterium sp.]|uniref:hypothetical protein n=1 Tax=Corynebacterium sp. TaxID=1720 RepID=UPI0025C57FB9|nr:hypothetical protein [Corynebacterium sp.]